MSLLLSKLSLEIEPDFYRFNYNIKRHKVIEVKVK